MVSCVKDARAAAYPYPGVDLPYLAIDSSVGYAIDPALFLNIEIHPTSQLAILRGAGSTRWDV